MFCFMKNPTPLFVSNAGLKVGISLIFSILIVFLQEGFTYYISVQSLALFCILMIILVSRPSLVNVKQIVPVFLLLSGAIVFTMTLSPNVISRNSPHIILSVVAILFYSLFIICLPNLVFKRSRLILIVFKYTSVVTVTSLLCLLVLTELPFFPFFSRKFFYLQNSRLVTNNTAQDVLMRHISIIGTTDSMLRIDLFYGEPSYLAVVLFSCISCFILTSLLLSKSMFEIKNNNLIYKNLIGNNFYKFMIISVVASLVYIKSLSSIIYAIIVFIFGFRPKIRRRFKMSSIYILFVSILILFFVIIQNYDYFVFRLQNLDKSLSLFQRFGSFLDFSLADYFWGLKDNSKIPQEGFHNGLIYILANAGIAGILYLFFLFRVVYILAKPIKISFLLILSILALIMQNGAIFSLNKIVLISLILLPLSCSRNLIFYKQPQRYSQR